MSHRFRVRLDAVQEARPGRVWRAQFDRLWPAHRAWFLREGDAARPSYLASERALRRWMPAMVPVWERLVELAGGGDLVARALAQYRPPPFYAACSQLALTTDEPVLLRSYDYSPLLFDGLITDTAWGGRRVIGTGDSLIGLLDGMNEDGLVVSLAFGGRRAEGDGFGIGIVLRHLLQTCTNVGEAQAALTAIPVHVPYNVALLDATGRYATVAVAPDRAPQVLPTGVSTNHQGAIDWPEYAALLETETRHALLEELAGDRAASTASLSAAFMEAPLYRTDYASGYGTLYTAAYLPARGEVRWMWPNRTFVESFGTFTATRFEIAFEDGAGAVAGAPGAAPGETASAGLP